MMFWLVKHIHMKVPPDFCLKSAGYCHPADPQLTSQSTFSPTV